MTAHTSAERLSTRICLSFGVGTVGVSIMLNAVTSYYPAFLSTVLGQSPEVAGYLMMASKLYDAVVDVLIGTWSDATRSRWGRRRPFLLAGALCSAVAFFMLFAPPVLSQTALILYMIAAQMLYSTAYSLFNVPYMAMPAELTHGYHERTRLLSFRTVFVSIGQLLAMAGTAAIIKQGGGNASAYAMMGLVMALVIGGAMTATALGTPAIHGPLVAGHSSHHPERAKIWPQLKLMTRNRPYMLLLGAKVFQFLAFASIGSTALLYMLNVLGVGYSGQIWLAITQNVVSAASMPLWVRLGKRLGKRNTYLVGVVLFCAAALSWLLAHKGIDTTGLLWRGVISGAGSGALILMSVSMLSDTMAYDRALTGQSREGLMSSTVAVIEKASFALGVALLGIFLRAFHYVPTVGGKLVTQPASAVLALTMGYAVIPMAMFTINGLFLWLYDLDERKLEEARAGRAAP